MKRYLAGRLGRFLFVFVFVTFLTTLLIDLVPGEAAVSLLGEGATDQQIEVVNHQYGLDDPVIVRYVRWMGDIVHGDFGTSFRTQQPVTDAIRERLPVSAELAVLSVLLSTLVAIALAMLTAIREGSVFDRAVGAVTSLFISFPPFFVALLLVYVFSVRLHLFPVTGWVPLTEDPWENLRHAVLPVITLSLTEIVILQRILRTDLLHTLRQDFILMARAKGLPRWRVLTGHALRPSSFSALTLTGLSLGRLMGGAVVVETVFALPGLGRLLITSILSKDLLMVQGVVTFLALAFIVLNLAVDLLYTAVDPRVRLRT